MKREELFSRIYGISFLTLDYAVVQNISRQYINRDAARKSYA